jgi:dCMP deaminase
VTHLPCINCTKALINAGIIRIVYQDAYRVDENAMGFLNAAEIEVVQHTNGVKADSSL